MKTIAVIILSLLPFFAISQKDTIYYFGVNGKVTDISNWEIKKQINYKSGKRLSIETFKSNENKPKNIYSEKVVRIDNNTYEIKVKSKLFSKSIIRKFELLENGKFRFYDYQKDVIVRNGVSRNKFPLILDGKVEEFYENGNKKSESVYENNELGSNKNWTELGEKYIDNVFFSVDEEPLFPDGMGRLHNHILNTFKNSGLDISQVTGKIVVGFVVMENGRLDGIKIEKGLNISLDNLALKAFYTLMGEWTPAKLNGNNVRYYQMFPINFVFNEYDYDFIDLSGGRLYWQIN